MKVDQKRKRWEGKEKRGRRKKLLKGLNLREKETKVAHSCWAKVVPRLFVCCSHLHSLSLASSLDFWARVAEKGGRGVEHGPKCCPMVRLANNRYVIKRIVSEHALKKFQLDKDMLAI